MNLYNFKMFTSLALYWSFILSISSISQAQDSNSGNEPITIGTVTTVDSEILNEERHIQIYLPDGYESSLNTRYPVLYLLDGETFFHHVTGIVDFLSGVYRIPPMIVVGVTNTERNRDMTPTKVKKKPLNSFTGDSLNSIPISNSGGADNFLRFLTDELVPTVESKYRTAPFRLLAGHSLSGLFTIHTLINSPKSFHTYLSFSPSLLWDDQILIQEARSKISDIPLDGRFLYLTVGDREMGSQIENLRTFAAIIEKSNPEGLRWWYRIMANESHPSVVHRSLYDGLEKTFSRYRVTIQKLSSGDLSEVEDQFTQASNFYGYDITVPEQLINLMGYMQLQFLQKPIEAVEIFRRNTELYPKSANTYDSLGDGYSAAGNLESAKESFEMAVRLAEQQEHPNLELYRNNLQRTIKQLKQQNEKDMGN